MQTFLTQETPGKVMALVGGVVASMLFLFLVSASGSGFDSRLSQAPLPQVALFEEIQAATDSFVAATGSSVYAYVVEPVQEDLASYGQSLAVMWSHVSGPVEYALGVEQSSAQLDVQSAPVTEQVALQQTPPSAGKVAGATTENSRADSFSVDTLYAVLFGR